MNDDDYDEDEGELGEEKVWWPFALKSCADVESLEYSWTTLRK